MSVDGDGIIGPQEARHGRQILRFVGRKLAEASTRRPGVQRWSSLAVYELPTGQLICQRIGHSTVAHDPECRLVTRRMPSWLEGAEECKIRRTPCPECQPLVGDQMDPHTRLEAQRYTVLQATDRSELITLLVDGRDHLPGIIRAVIEDLSS